MRRKNPFNGPPIVYPKAVQDAFRPPSRCTTTRESNNLERINVTRQTVSPRKHKRAPPMVRSLSEFDLDSADPPTCLSTPEPKNRHAMRRTYSCNPDRCSQVFDDGAALGPPERADGSRSPYDGILEGSCGRSSKEVARQLQSVRTYAHAPTQLSVVDQVVFGRDVEPFNDNHEGGASGLQTRDSKTPIPQGRIKFHDPLAPRNCIGRIVFRQENKPLDKSYTQAKVNMQDRFAGAAGVHSLEEPETGTTTRALIEDHPCRRSQITEDAFRSTNARAFTALEAKHRPFQRGAEGAAGSRPADAWELRNYENPRALRKPRGDAGQKVSTRSRILGEAVV